jgi:hypothetical protein
MLDRSRLFLGLSDWHIGQSHPIEGTPKDVPVPRKTTFMNTKTSNINVQLSKIEKD